MPLDAVAVARFVTDECGLSFRGHRLGDKEIELRPDGVPVQNAFALRIATGWRNIDLTFVPGAYSADLIEDMARADEEARKVCSSVLVHCAGEGAAVTLTIDGQKQSVEASDQWPATWSKFGLSMRKGQVEFGDDGSDFSAVPVWAGRLAAAVAALLPLEEIGDEPETAGFPEGAAAQVTVNRYERDRRNRAAAIAIHGVSCAACGLDMGERYGAVAVGFIEVHHLTPVSQLGEGYLLNPATDLIPLHGVAHRREPPFTPVEISLMLPRPKVQADE